MFAERNAVGMGLAGYASMRSGSGLLPWQFSWITEFWDGYSPDTISLNANKVTAWAPKKGTHSFTQGTDANRPTYANGIVTGDNVGQFLVTGSFTLVPPFTVVECFAATNWASNRWLLSGLANSGAGVQQAISSPRFQLNCTSVAAINPNAALSTFCIVAFGFSGSSSYIRVGNTTPTTGDIGAAMNPNGLVWNAFDSSGTAPAGKQSKGIALANTLLTTPQLDQLFASMSRRYGAAL